MTTQPANTIAGAKAVQLSAEAEIDQAWARALGKGAAMPSDKAAATPAKVSEQSHSSAEIDAAWAKALKQGR